MARKSQKDTVNELVIKFKAAHKYVKENYHDVWNDSWKVYNNQRVRVHYEGDADTFVPETFTIVESLVANIGGGQPKFEFLPVSAIQEQDTEIINSLIGFYWDQNNMNLKALQWIRDMIIFGNGVTMVTWDEKDIPRIDNIPLKDFFVDSDATSIEDAEERKLLIGHRRLVSKKTLKAATIYDPETDSMVPKYKNINKIQPLEKAWDKFDKEEKEMFAGSTKGEDAPKDMVEVLYMLVDDRVYEIANRDVAIWDEETPFQRKETTEQVVITDPQSGLPIEEEVTIPAIAPFYPYTVLRNYADASLFYAKGDVEVILPTQELVNDINNQKQDNITYVLNNMWTIDPQFADMAPEIESLPGAVYAIPAGALQPIEKPIVTNDADNEIFQNLDYMRRATAADEIVQGASQAQGRITATEVQAQVNQANQRFSTKLNMLESEGYAHLGSIMFKLIQIFVTQPIAVRLIGPQGTEWGEFNPLEFTGQYEPRVILEATSRALKAEEGQKFQQMYQVLLEDPTINQSELKSILLKKVFNLEQAEIEKLLSVDPAQAEQQFQTQQALNGNVESGVPSAPLPIQPVI